jgi:hypothetical protein
VSQRQRGGAGDPDDHNADQRRAAEQEWQMGARLRNGIA